MPEIYYQVIALAMRYVFAGICFLIVLRTFYWQRVEHRAWKQRVRQLPDIGYIGEFYAVRGTSAFPAGTILHSQEHLSDASACICSMACILLN